MSDTSHAGEHGRRARLVAATSVVAVALTLTTACAGGPVTAAPSPSGGPSTTPAPTTPAPSTPEPTTSPAPPGTTRTTAAGIPAAAMLRATDIGPGFTTSDDRRIVMNDHGSLTMLLAYCGQYGYGPAHEDILADRTRAAGDGTMDRGVYQLVERYSRADAQRYLAGLRTVLPKCRTLSIQHDSREHSTLTVVGTGRYGDDSLLIRHDRERYDGVRELEYLAVVRQGEIVTIVRIHIGATEARAREIVRRLAQRLCAATAAC
jgi:hypothetical protein